MMSLIDRLTHPDPTTREDALLALSVEDQPSDEDLRALADMLRDDSPRIREIAAQMLGSGARFVWGIERIISTLPAQLLLPALADRSATVRENILNVLRYYPVEESIRCATEPLRCDPVSIVRVKAVAVLWVQGQDLRDILPVIEAAIRSGDTDAVITSCHFLMEIGPSAGDMVPLVWGCLRHPDGMVRGNAAYALFKCCSDKRVLAEAAEVLKADSEETLAGALIRFVAHKLRKAAEAEPAAIPDQPRD